MTTCPSPEELSRAVSQHDGGSLAEHVASCERCRTEWNGALRIRALARDIASPSIDPAAARQVRERLLVAFHADRRRAGRKRAARWSAFAIAAITTLAVGLHGRHARDSGTEAHYHATVTALPGARFVRESPRPNEVVRLEAGAIHVEVAPLESGERFIVRAGEGEVEVRGTAFDVAVLDGHLATVRVAHGRVEVRDPGASPAVLETGGAWEKASSAPAASSSVGSEAPSAASEVPLEAPAAAVGSRLSRHSIAPSTAGSPATPPTSPPSPGAATNAGPAPTIAAPHEDVIPDPFTRPAPAPTPVAPPRPPPARSDAEERRERREERHEREDERRMR